MPRRVAPPGGQVSGDALDQLDALAADLEAVDRAWARFFDRARGCDIKIIAVTASNTNRAVTSSVVRLRRMLLRAFDNVPDPLGGPITWTDEDTGRVLTPAEVVERLNKAFG